MDVRASVGASGAAARTKVCTWTLMGDSWLYGRYGMYCVIERPVHSTVSSLFKNTTVCTSGVGAHRTCPTWYMFREVCRRRCGGDERWASRIISSRVEPSYAWAVNLDWNHAGDLCGLPKILPKMTVVSVRGAS